jgi:LmbE family N-acetylglucosaminyl deacetylase
MKRILLVVAHPDDESFMTGGTVAKYVDDGWEADVICATRGEEGERGPLVQLARDKVGEVRQKELEKAGAVLGIHSVTFLGYRDGTLPDRIPGDIEDMVHKKMLELIPDIVITADTTGISNHPDHIKLSYATTYAFQKYAKWIEERLKDQEATEQIFPKLYYACMPASIAAFAVKSKTHPPESFGKPWKGVPDKNITTVVDISDYADVKERALRCHITQTADVDRFFSVPGRPLMKNEYYIFRMHGTTEVFLGKNDHVFNSL